VVVERNLTGDLSAEEELRETKGVVFLDNEGELEAGEVVQIFCYFGFDLEKHVDHQTVLEGFVGPVDVRMAEGQQLADFL
jgi:hypothetical protein